MERGHPGVEQQQLHRRGEVIDKASFSTVFSIL
jgi:hypothetical protein